MTPPNLDKHTRSYRVPEQRSGVRTTCATCGGGQSGKPSLPSLATWDTYRGARQICGILQALQGVDQVAIDVETTGLAESDRIRTVQLAARSGDPIGAAVLCLETPEGEADADARAAVTALLPGVLRGQTWAYSRFDERMLAADLGVREPILDAAALHHLIDQQTATRSAPLETALAVRFGAVTDLSGADTVSHSVVCPTFGAYAAFAAAGLLVLVEEWIDASNWTPEDLLAWLGRESRISEACEAMTRKGLPLAGDGITEVESAALAVLRPAEKTIKRLEPGLNINSPSQLQRAYEERGVPMPLTRRKRADGTIRYTRSTSHRDVCSNDPLVVAVNRVRSATGVVTTLRTWEDLAQADGRVHGRLHPLGARTGRWTSTAPNLQNVAKADHDGLPSLRRAIRTGPGLVFVQADLSAIEYRCAAGLSGDTAMLAAFDNGEDLHMMAARALTGVAEPTKHDREKAKAIGFGKLYGQGPEATAEACGVSLPEMLDRIARYDDTFPQLAAWAREVEEHTQACGLVTPVNPYGRRYTVSAAYLGVNYLVQSTAREVFCDWMLAVVDAGLGSLLVAGIHDELLLEVPEEIAVSVAESVTAAAASVSIPGQPRVAIVAEARVAGRSWASAYED